MSKVSISGDQNGTGNFTIAAPNSNTDRTLTLPDEAGSVLTDVSDISAANLTGDVAAERITGALNATGSAPVYACRAWVNFDGTNGSVRDSGNVSSVTEVVNGEFQINFTTNMPDNNYSVVALGSSNPTASGYVGLDELPGGNGDTEIESSRFVLRSTDRDGGQNSDHPVICAAAFR